MNKRLMVLRSLIYVSMIIFLLAACSPSNPTLEGTPIAGGGQGNILTSPTSSNPTAETPSISPSPTQTPQPTQPPEPTSSPAPSATRTVAPSPTPAYTSPPTITPTYAILRGTILEQANCRYGPGAAYLYKYGVYADYYMDIIGRNETGTWVVVQAIGGTNPCWVKASLINIKGDVMSLAPTWLPLPESPYYGPLSGVWADRSGDTVIISWNPLVLRAGDDSLQYPYLVEAWLCQGGRLTFTPIGSWETMATVKDETGCSDPSHARVYGVEKHGYTAWVNVPWPTR